MPRPKRDMFRTSIFLPSTLDETLAQVSAAREKKVGFAPLMADLLREAAIRGAACMLADEGKALTYEKILPIMNSGSRPIVRAAEAAAGRGKRKARKPIRKQ